MIDSFPVGDDVPAPVTDRPFPVPEAAAVRLVLGSALATRVTWERPFELTDSAELRAMRESKLPYAEMLCSRAHARGELRPGYQADFIDEIVPALLFMRGFAMGQPLDDDYLDHLTDDIILPLLTR